MEFIENHHEVYVEMLLWICELLVFMYLYREKNFDAPSILIVNQTFLLICVVDEPLKDLYER
jgi:hypothetical protein